MTGPCFRFLWQEPEYSTVDENLVFHLKDDAPEIAKKTIKSIKDTIHDYSLVIAPVVADLCTTPVALSAPPNSYQNNSQS